MFKRASFIRLLLSKDLVTSLVAAEIGQFFLTWNKPTQVYVRSGIRIPLRPCMVADAGTLVAHPKFVLTVSAASRPLN